ncbi:MAG: ABC transporter substrate-binding protein [Rhodospirillales bacterium]|nr:ABC transporter substrate-binding protein [Rhodospirillales bacterium]
MRLVRRSFLAGAAAGAALPFLSIPGRAAAKPGTLVFGLSSYPPSLLPWVQAGTAAGTVNLCVHRGLTSYAPDGTLRGELAEKFDHDDKNGWTFHLRKAVFHDGSPVTSADVKWTLEQVAAAGSTAYMAPQFRGVAAIETPDAATVRIVMKEPTATLPLWLAQYEMPIVAHGTGIAGKPAIGCGPFTIAAQDHGVSVTLKAFPHFYRPGLPKLETLRMVAYADETARVAALRTGDVDIIEYVPWNAMAAIEANPKLALQTTNGPFMYLTFNGSFKPFADARVRRAIALGVKREDIVKAVFFGRGSPLGGMPIPPGTPFYDAKLANGWTYDPTEAKKLLAEAGYAQGFSCTLLATAQYSMHMQTAVLVQQNLAALGIQVQLALPDWATRVALGNRGQYQFAVGGTSADSNDPDGLSAIIDSSLAPSVARSYDLPVPKIAALFAQGRAEFDPAKRRAIYDQLQRVLLAEAPMVSLAWRSQGYGLSRKVSGFYDMPGALTFFSGTTLEQTSIA